MVETLIEETSSELIQFDLSAPKTTIVNMVIGDLRFQEVAFSLEEKGAAIGKVFQDNPGLPGILLRDGDSYIGMISREKFYEWLSRPFGIELFLKRPIRSLYQEFGVPALILPASTYVNDAVSIALKRPADQLYEPIVIEFDEKRKTLLDIHILLLAQSELLKIINKRVEQQAEMGKVLAGTLELPEVLERLLSHIEQVLWHDYASVYLFRNHEFSLLAERTTDIEKGLKPLSLQNNEKRNFYKALETQEAFLTMVKYVAWETRQVVNRSWMIIPLISAGIVVGMLSIMRSIDQGYAYRNNSNGRPFSKEDLNLLRSYADQAAVSIQNAQIITEFKQWSKNLDEKVEERTREYLDELRRRERIDAQQNEVLSGAVNDLSSPLFDLHRLTYLLVDHPKVKENPDLANIVSELSQNALASRRAFYQIEDLAKDKLAIVSNL